MDDEYRTIVRPSCVETKVQGSRFIGEAMTAPTVAEAQTALEAIRKREHAATHHCYGWRIGHEAAPVFKYSDDGEPNGTAGRPIFDAICGVDLTDTLVVVTRYFGGTKLGTGGLAHAYSEAAVMALKEAGQAAKYLTYQADCTLEFGQYDRWQKLLGKIGATVTSVEFTSLVSTRVGIRRSRFEELQRAFVELTAGKGRFEKVLLPESTDTR